MTFMPRFEPRPSDPFSLNGNTFQIMEHPSAPSIPYSQEGRKAVVYQVADQNKKLFALKVFKQAYRLPALVNTCETLKTLVQPGLEVCDRICIDEKIAPELIKKYPDLEYAVIMPWINGRTWVELILSGMPISRQNSLVAARNVAQVLGELEKSGFAHCDIAGANLMVNPITGKISFVDVEDMFGPGLLRPNACPKGTDGYRHSRVKDHPDGQWRLDGDRFSAAIILGEILCWHDENFRKIRDSEHYFSNHELQDQNSPRYSALLKILGGISPDLLESFKKAWQSRDLSECPTAETWHSALESITIEAWKPIIMPAVSLPLEGLGVSNLKYSQEIPAGLTNLARSQIYPAGSVRIDQKMVLRWQSIQGAYRYELQSASSDLAVQQDHFETIYHGSQPFFEIAHDKFGAFYYRVRSLAESHTSSWSPIEVVYVYPPNKPASPKIYPINNFLGDRSYVLKWSAVENAQWYEVEETIGDWPFNQSKLVAFNDSARIKDTRILLVGKQARRYTYRVRAYNFCGYGEYSSPVAVDVKPPLVSKAPQILKIDNQTGISNYSISWGMLPGAAGYILFESLLPEIDQAQRIYQGSANRFMVTGKNPGQYYYTVTAHDSNGQYDSQLFSGWVSTQVVLHTPVWHMPNQFYDVPQNDHTGDAEFQLVWKPVAWASKYDLAWEDDMGISHIETWNSNSCMFRRPEGKYEFKVRAVSEKNLSSEWSFPISITVKSDRNSCYKIVAESNNR